MSRKLEKLIVILGPTASGKSGLAVELAKKFNGEIVSADSRQIYKEMDIGTGKITKREMEGVPHYLIDIIKPSQEFTLAQYKKRALEVIKKIQKKGKVPFLVGGTGLYIKAIVDNLNIPQVAPNKKLRKELEAKTNQQLLAQLKKLDPDSAKTIDVYNKRRLVRALEVCLATKKPFSQLQTKGKLLFDVLQIGLFLSKERLDRKIEQRVTQMMKRGLFMEVKKLVEKYPKDYPALSGLGYQEIRRCLKGEMTLTQAIGEIKKNTRQYARRQMTWFKKDPASKQARYGTSKRINWIENQKEAEKLIGQFLS